VASSPHPKQRLRNRLQRTNRNLPSLKGALDRGREEGGARASFSLAFYLIVHGARPMMPIHRRRMGDIGNESGAYAVLVAPSHRRLSVWLTLARCGGWNLALPGQLVDFACQN
jgi:hypothetical protein